MKLDKTDKKSILPFIEGLTFPMTMISNHWKDFLRLVGFAAVITSFITIFMGRSNYCGLLQGLEISFYCPFSSYAAYLIPISFFVVMFFSGFVYNRWQLIFAKNMDFSAAIKEKCRKKDIKSACFLFMYILFLILLGAGLLALDRRIPNPNWQIELMFFVAVSLSILAMVILLFNFVIFQRMLSGGSFLEIKKTFMPLFDNIYKIVCWFFIYFFIFIYLLRNVVLVFADKSFPIWFNIIFGEISFYFVIYSVVAVFSGAMFYQEKNLFSEEK